MSSLEDKLTTDVIFQFALNLSAKIKGVVFIPIIASGLSVGAYGAYMQLLAVTSILTIISGFNLESGFINHSQKENVSPSSLYYSILVFSLIIGGLSSIIVSINANLISDLTLNTSKYSYVYNYGSLLVPIGLMSKMSMSYYRSQMRIKTGAVLRAIRDYFTIIAVALLVYLFDINLYGVVITIVLVELLYSSILQYLVIMKIGISKPKFSRLTNVFRYSLWLTVSTLASQLSTRADRLLLGFFIGSSAVGIYSIAYGIGSAILLLIGPIRNTFFPEFSRLLANGREELVQEYTFTGVRYFLTFAVPGVVGLWLVSGELFRLLSSYTDYTRPDLVIVTIAIGILLLGLDKLHGIVLIAGKNTKSVAIVRSTASFCNILLNLYLIPIMGVLGAAIATAITYGLSAIWMHLIFRRSYSFKYQIRPMAIVFLATFIMYSMLKFLNIKNILLLITFGLIIYMGLIILLGGVPRKKLREVIGRQLFDGGS